MAAAQGGHLEVVRLLLDYGAEIHAVDKASTLCKQGRPTPHVLRV